MALSKQKKILGLTLLELMTVIAILGILATMAIASYRHYIIKADRTDGITSLVQLATNLEHYFEKNNTYATATIGKNNLETDVRASNKSDQSKYILSIIEQTDHSYTIQAAPVSHEDTVCQSFTFDHTGKKSITGTGTVEQCWG